MVVEIRYSTANTTHDNRDALGLELETLLGRLDHSGNDVRIQVIPTESELAFRYRVRIFGRNGGEPFKGRLTSSRLYTSEELRAKS